MIAMKKKSLIVSVTETAKIERMFAGCGWRLGGDCLSHGETVDSN